MIDTHPGLNEETLLSIAISDALLIILRPDQQDYQGTSVTVEVARKLDVPRLMLIVNKVPAVFDTTDVRARVEQTYGCEVAAVLPHADEMMALASSGLFVLRYPQHPITAALRQVAADTRRLRARWPPDELFTRDEALGGLPARRAAALLFLIEGRAAHLADQSRRVGDFLASEDASRERDLAFLEAFSVGREPPVKPTIQDLERYAPRWAALVPANPSLRAAVAHLLARKYAFTRRAVPEIRAALGLDDDAVKRAYRRQHGVDLETLYAAQVGIVDWLRWAWTALSARVDTLSPFWLTFWLTIAFSFSQAFLALPTGVARVGALPGRGPRHCGRARQRADDGVHGRGVRPERRFPLRTRIRRTTRDQLPGDGSVSALLGDDRAAHVPRHAGRLDRHRTHPGDLHGDPGRGWMVLLVLVELYYLSRKSSAVTVTTMLSMVSLNLLVLLVIDLLAFRQARAREPLVHAPAPGGRGAARPGTPEALVRRRRDALHRARVHDPVREDRAAARSERQVPHPRQRGRNSGVGG